MHLLVLTTAKHAGMQKILRPGGVLVFQPVSLSSQGQLDQGLCMTHSRQASSLESVAPGSGAIACRVAAYLLKVLQGSSHGQPDCFRNRVWHSHAPKWFPWQRGGDPR